MKNNIDRKMEPVGDLTEKEYLKELENQIASETRQEEKDLSDFMDMKYQMALDKYLENNPGKTEKDFQDQIRRLSLESGGKVIKFSDYKDPVKKVKELDLASMFTPGKTLAELSEKERDAVNTLLKLTFGKKD
jgi:hypothetical protein